MIEVKRAGLKLAELGAVARGLDLATLTHQLGAAFLLRQSGLGMNQGASLTQTLLAQRTATRDEPASNLPDYQVYLIRRYGGARFGGEYVGIGRGEHNDIVIEEQSISKFHAFIVQDDVNFSLSDAGSKNGTWVNDQPVESYRVGKAVPLHDGDRLRLGDVRLTYMIGESVWRLLQRVGVNGG